MSLCGLILSAGKSERMGSFKPLLKVGEKTFISSIIDNYIKLKLDENIVICGYNRDELKKYLEKYNLIILDNLDYHMGQMSSIKVGINYIKGKYNNVLLSLVDRPLVKYETYYTLKCSSIEFPNSIIIPSYHNRKGHPIVIHEEIFNEILQCPLEYGLNTVIHRYNSIVKIIEMEDPNILINIDTPELYQKYCE